MSTVNIIKSDLQIKHELTKEEESIGNQLLEPGSTQPPFEIKVYKRRWAILIVFMLFGLISSMSWIQYSIIANIIMRYYNVSSYAVDWTSISFMLTYIPLIFPASYIVDKKGLLVSTIIGTFGTALGSWIKVFSVAPDRFVVAFVGHTIIGMSQVFLLSLPPRLAAVWFGANQVSTACSLAIFGNQLGVAAGFLLPPILIKNHANIDDIGTDLLNFNYGMAGVSTVIFFLVILVFKKKPEHSPSMAQALQEEGEKENFLTSMKRLMLNNGYILLLITYGINLGVFNALSTLLNQLILKYFADSEEFAGRVGLVLILSGMLGSIVGGVVLDKTHRYKDTTLALYVFGLIGMFGFAYLLEYKSQLVVYATSTLLGFCLGGYMPVGFELAMELTYPEPEATSTGILMAVCQTVSVIFTVVYSWLMTAVGDVWANVVLCGALSVGTLLTALIPPTTRRQAAQRMHACND